jgi:hypothetical protein
MRLLFIGFCFWFSSVQGQNINATVTYKVSNNEVIFTLRYSNIGKDTLALWIQNWRLTLLTDKRDKFYGFPFGRAMTSQLVLLSDTADLMTQLSQIEYSVTSGSSINTPCIKMLLPNSEFFVEIRCSDFQLLNYIRNKKLQGTLILCSARRSDLKRLGQLSDYIYEGRIMTVDLRLTNKSPRDVSTESFPLDNISRTPLYYSAVNDVFRMFLVKNALE